MEKVKVILICWIFIFMTAVVAGQQRNWQNLDLAKDSVFGMSTEKAYAELLKGKKAEPVVVAIIDTGIDTSHEDLQGVVWTDRKTGIHGWNYIGGETGKEDITSLVGDKKDFYDSLTYTPVPEIYRAGYQQYKKIAPALETKINDMKTFIARLEHSGDMLESIVKKINKINPSAEDFRNYKPSGEEEKALVEQVIRKFSFYGDWHQLKQMEIDSLIKLAKYHLAHGLNINNSEPDTAMGDPNVSPDAPGLGVDENPVPMHGTIVAGIIGADRNNSIGMNGIADHVQIMMLKVNGNIREIRDKSLASAIRFAVDHGAGIINLSFGKPYTWDKKDVDNAVRYAMDKDVLIIHAAGNNAENLDNTAHYPNSIYADNPGTAKAWIEVGASRPYNDSVMVAAFSNYGKRTVDVFAPGTGIYSTIPGSKYDWFNGTSMAAPVVAGLAALLREYYPKLRAVQVKEIILKSVVKVSHNVYIKNDNGALQSVPFSDVCISGGIVNAFNALKLAATYK